VSKKKSFSPLHIEKLNTTSLSKRKSKVHVDAFAKPSLPGRTLSEFIEGLPRILAGEDFRQIVDLVLRAVHDL